MFRTSICAAAILTVAMAVPAAAQDSSSRTVRYGDLNLASARGQAVLQRRIARAITLVCGDPQPLGVTMHKARSECIASARADANQQLAAVLGQKQQMAANTIRVGRH